MVHSMFERAPCLRIKHRKPNGQFFEIEIRASLIRWLLVLILVLTLLARGSDPIKVLRLLPVLDTNCSNLDSRPPSHSSHDH
jgi:hypothetical protein